MCSLIVLAVNGFAVNLITGSIGFPIIFPCPVGNKWILNPPAAWRVTHSAAAEDVSIKYNPFPLLGSSAGSRTSMNSLDPIFWKFPKAFSSIVVNPPAIFPAVGWLSDRSLVASFKMKSLYELQVFINLSWASLVLPLLAQTFSAPVNSDVSPKQRWTPKGSSLSIKFPTVGFDANPDVVSDSPHFTEIHKSLIGHSSLCFSEAHIENSWAFLETFAIVSISPTPSILNPSTGFPVFAIASTILLVHLGSIPITMTAATLGFLPVPIIVLKCNSRSAPNCNLP